MPPRAISRPYSADRLCQIFNWEMVRKGTGDVAGVGLEFLVLGADGRIRIDYQFIES